MSKITITKGKILKGDKVEVSFTKISGAKNKPASCNEEHFEPPHPDLINALAKLTVHAILIGEFENAKKIQKIEDITEEKINSFHVSGFSISGKDDEGVTITAQKQLNTGKMMGFNTPFVVFSDDSENAYPFMKELKAAIDVCRKRFEDYLNGTFKDDGQLGLYDEKD